MFSRHWAWAWIGDSRVAALAEGCSKRSPGGHRRTRSLLSRTRWSTDRRRGFGDEERLQNPVAIPKAVGDLSAVDTEKLRALALDLNRTAPRSPRAALGSFPRVAARLG